MSEAPRQTTEVLPLLGGTRHGTTVEVTAGTSTWVDLLSASTYHRARFPYVAVDPANPRSRMLRKGYTAEVLVHEDIYNDPHAARVWLQSLALIRWFEQYGRSVDVSTIIPDTGPGGAAAEQNGGGN
jgi:hypothetical protein